MIWYLVPIIILFLLRIIFYDLTFLNTQYSEALFLTPFRSEGDRDIDWRSSFIIQLEVAVLEIIEEATGNSTTRCGQEESRDWTTKQWVFPGSKILRSVNLLHVFQAVDNALALVMKVSVLESSSERVEGLRDEGSEKPCARPTIEVPRGSWLVRVVEEPAQQTTCSGTNISNIGDEDRLSHHHWRESCEETTPGKIGNRFKEILLVMLSEHEVVSCCQKKSACKAWRQ